MKQYQIETSLKRKRKPKPKPKRKRKYKRKYKPNYKYKTSRKRKLLLNHRTTLHTVSLAISKWWQKRNRQLRYGCIDAFRRGAFNALGLLAFVSCRIVIVHSY